MAETESEVTVKINGLMKFVLLLVAVACTICAGFVLFAFDKMEDKLVCFDRRFKSAMVLMQSGNLAPNDMLDLMGMCSEPEDTK